MDPGQVEDGADLANQMIVRHHLIEAELVEQLPLVSIEPPHHRPSPSRIARGKRNHPRRRPSTDFCNKICQYRTHAPQQTSGRAVPMVSFVYFMQSWILTLISQIFDLESTRAGADETQARARLSRSKRP